MRNEIEERIYFANIAKDWKGDKKHGDVTTIANLLNVSTVTISKAINKGIGSLKVLRLIEQYFQFKKINNE
jgi:hypothetical protein